MAEAEPHNLAELRRAISSSVSNNAAAYAADNLFRIPLSQTPYGSDHSSEERNSPTAPMNPKVFCECTL
jgi:hypothetical protein